MTKNHNFFWFRNHFQKSKNAVYKLKVVLKYQEKNFEKIFKIDKEFKELTQTVFCSFSFNGMGFDCFTYTRFADLDG